MTDQLTSSTVEAYLSTLEGALRGHARDKSRLLLELRDGIEDAAAAQVAGGLPPLEASRQALRGFGSVELLVEACQPELSVRQVRRTAWMVTLTVPALIAWWHALLGPRADQLPRAAIALGEHLAGVGAMAAVLGALALLVTGPLSRWLQMPRRLPMLVAVTGIVGAATMALAPLAMAAATPSTAAMWPPVLLAAVAAAVPLSTVTMAAWLCRSCATAPV